jgi:L-seryl-tRNA(Ser) seleniumtransferase
VGTTNRVHLKDYSAALEEPAALVMRAHPSNFRIIGFTSEPELSEITAEAHAHGAYFVDDLGSGALLDTARYGLAHEPTVQESLDAGSDLVCFSGDKLLGGPQAGIIVGRADLLAKIKKHPLARAVRADKLCLAALSATLLHYIKDETESEIPVWKMICRPPDEIRVKVEQWADILGIGEVLPGLSTVGGGSLPEETLPTYLLALDVNQPNKFLQKLRAMDPPLIGRIESEKVVFDPRTVFEEQESTLLDHIKQALDDTPMRTR